MVLFENLQTPEGKSTLSRPCWLTAPVPSRIWTGASRPSVPPLALRDLNPQVQLAGRPHSHLDIGTLPFGKLSLKLCKPGRNGYQQPTGSVARYPRFNLQGALIATWKWAPCSSLKICKRRKHRIPPAVGLMASGASGIRTREFVLQGALIATWKWPPWQPGRSPGFARGFARLCAASCPCKHDIFNREENPLKCWNHFLPWPSPLMYSCPPARVTSSKVLPLLSGMQDMEDLVTHWAMRTFDPLVTLCVKCTHQSTMNTSLQATHICLELQWAHSSVEGHTWCCQVKRQCVQRFQATLTPVIMTAEADLRCFFSHHTAT